jgi:hypothetical protein
MGTSLRTIALMAIALMIGAAACAWAEEEATCSKVGGAAATYAAAELDPTLEMGVTENARGIVYFYDERTPECLATIGTRHGLRPQAIVAVMRHGEEVAKGIVYDVRIADCVVHPAPGTPAGAVVVGDALRVLINGPREAMDAKIRREHSDRALATIATYALFFGHIWAVRY